MAIYCMIKSLFIDLMSMAINLLGVPNFVVVIKGFQLVKSCTGIDINNLLAPQAS